VGHPPSSLRPTPDGQTAIDGTPEHPRLIVGGHPPSPNQILDDATLNHLCLPHGPKSEHIHKLVWCKERSLCRRVCTLAEDLYSGFQAVGIVSRHTRGKAPDDGDLKYAVDCKLWDHLSHSNKSE